MWDFQKQIQTQKKGSDAEKSSTIEAPFFAQTCRSNGKSQPQSKQGNLKYLITKSN